MLEGSDGRVGGRVCGLVTRVVESHETCNNSTKGCGVSMCVVTGCGISVAGCGVSVTGLHVSVTLASRAASATLALIHKSNSIFILKRIRPAADSSVGGAGATGLEVPRNFRH